MSTNTILVAYATRTGSTAGIAETIGKTLLEQGAQVAVQPVQTVADPSPYRAVVLGSAIQGHEWLPEAMEFLRTHQAALRQKPFAAFLVCMTMVMKAGAYQDEVATWMEPVRALVPPISEGYFPGILDIKKIPQRQARWGFRLSVMTGVWKEGDHRDWEAVQNWATDLAPLLRDEERC